MNSSNLVTLLNRKKINTLSISITIDEALLQSMRASDKYVSTGWLAANKKEANLSLTASCWMYSGTSQYKLHSKNTYQYWLISGDIVPETEFRHNLLESLFM